jgi:hypothetical protein
VVSPTDTSIRLPREFKEKGCVVFHGSIQSSDMLAKVETPLTPGAIGNFENFRYSTLLSHWGYWFVNKQPIFAPMGTICHNFDYYQGVASRGSNPVGQIFIRPDSGRKSFSGQLLSFGDIKRYQLAKDCGDEAWVCVATAKKIVKEWRVLIVDKEVVTACRYRRNGMLEMVKEFPPSVREQAEFIAGCDWQPDIAYMLDIGLVIKPDSDSTGDELRIIEANPFSTSDLYCMDYEKVIDALNRVAVKQWSKIEYSPGQTVFGQ